LVVVVVVVVVVHRAVCSIDFVNISHLPVKIIMVLACMPCPRARAHARTHARTPI